MGNLNISNIYIKYIGVKNLSVKTILNLIFLNKLN